MPEVTVLRDSAGRTIDLMPLASDGMDRVASGEIAGRRVPCVSLDTQVRFHGGYAQRDVDRVDLAHLAARFGVTADGMSISA